MVDTIDIESRLGYLAPCCPASGTQVPEVLWRLHAASEPTAHADDGNRYVRVHGFQSFCTVEDWFCAGLPRLAVKGAVCANGAQNEDGVSVSR